MVCEMFGLEYELRKRGLEVLRQVSVPIRYEEVVLEEGYRADLIVEGKVIVELKSVEQLAPVHFKQVLTYIRLDEKRLGLLINFGEALIKDGIRRIVNNLRPHYIAPLKALCNRKFKSRFFAQSEDDSSA